MADTQNINEQIIDAITALHEKITHLESEITDIKSQVKENKKPKRSIDYTQIDGVIGTFDGSHMVTESGDKYEVPANYAAKTKIVFGDVLKMIKDKNRNLFKHVDKVEREKIHGILLQIFKKLN